MHHPAPHRLPAVAALAVALLAIGCAAPNGSAAPTIGQTPPAASATSGPTPEPSPASTPTPTPETTCAPIDFATFVASERLTNIELAPGAGGDLLGFTLAPSPGSPMRPRLTVTSVEPPFSYGGSGLPFDIAGAHHLRVRFEGMLHVDDAGNVVYVGPNDLSGRGGPVAQVVLEEAYESYVSFVVGYDGNGCVALQVTPALVTIAIEAR